MIYDKEFLLQLDKAKEKEIYARVTALSFQERPITTIEGRITSGSINVDGDSAVRRTCSLSLVAENFDYSNYTWGMNTKFKLEVGVKNTINVNYPEIIWFPQGIYVLTSFNTSRSTKNFTISLQGKDKMCQLNGDVGGTLESMVDFGTEETVDALGNVVITRISIPTIIRNMIHHYGGEPYYNILINDLDDYAVELLEYRYDDDLYLYRDADSDTVYYDNILLNPDTPCRVEGKDHITKLGDLGPEELDLLVDTLTGTPNPSKVWMEGHAWYVAKIKFGQTAGYRHTELTYPGDLIANAGETVTSVLDKIKSMFSDFEYFYNLDGQFVFQKKQSFVNTLWTPMINNEDEEEYVENLALASSCAYVFSGGELITSFNNTPNLLNVRNDYSIWGTREASGRSDPVHMRYAIDIKPTYYKTIDGRLYVTDLDVFEKMKEQAKADTLNAVRERIANYKPIYEIPHGLTKPTKQENGSWDAGWWDIRDWHDYYYALTLTEPSYTMKWYSRNNREGCVPANTLPGHSQDSPERYVWLIIHTPGEERFNLQHGSGQPSDTAYTRTLHHSYYTPGGWVTEPFLDENGNNVTKDFINPYAGCADDHTYIEFLEDDVKAQGNNVYFYNPDFPDYNGSFDEMVNDQIEKEYQDYLKSGKLNFVDWREIIYQMAKDYFQHGTEDDFEIQIRNNNMSYYPTGITGYEHYYTDISGFWRYLYDPELETKLKKKETEKKNYDSVIEILNKDTYTDNQMRQYVNNKTIIENLPESIPLIKRMIVYQDTIITDLKKGNIQNYQQVADNENYLSSLQRYLINLESKLNKNIDLSAAAEESIEKYQTDLLNYYDKDSNYPFWNRAVYEQPESLLFWFDFIGEGELANFNVQAIGARSKVINDTSIKAIYFRETPNVIFVTSDEEIGINTAYKYIQVTNIDSMFMVSDQGKSAKDRLDELIYTHGYCVENVTINAVPVYYLQPNTRVHLFDEKAGLNGDYIISKMTIPLAYNGTMSITATKAAENVI